MSRLLLLTLALTLTPSAHAADRNDLKPGLVAAISDGTRSVTRLDPTVGLTLPAGDAAHPRLGRTTAITWTGYLNVVTAGEYAFMPATAGGKLTVTVGGKPATPTIALAPGPQPFVAAFTADPAATAVRVELRWQGPGFRNEPIPYFFFGHVPAERPPQFAADVASDHGRFLYEELGCQKCHPQPGLADRRGPNLAAVGQRAYAGWLYAWLGDPAKVRPHTTMPKMFADDEAGHRERFAVTQYLVSLGGPISPAKNPGFSNEFRKNVAAGEALFTTTGCTACHGPQLAAAKKKTDDDDDSKPPPHDALSSIHGFGTATGAQAIYQLGGLGSKTTPEQLAKYLQDPLKTNPHGRMPNMVLSGTEARDLALHLCRQTDDAIPKELPKAHPPVNESWIEMGKRVATAKGCANCHTFTPKDEAKVTPIRNSPAGCLLPKPDPAKVPAYSLTADHRGAIAQFLTASAAISPSPTFAARAALKRFNCLNCHQRDGEGGIGGDLAEKMRLLEKAQTADDLTPPRLTGVGHKARSPWLKSVLTGNGRARPWMTLRMPQYGDAHVGFLADALAHLDGTVPDTEAKKPDFAAAKLDAGRTLAGKNGHGCVTCHDIAGVVGGGTRGPDLALTKDRVRFDWYERWMHDPQRLAPGTKMPSVFTNGKALLTTVFNGDADKQTEALWAYLSLGPGLPLPSGLEPPKGLIVAVKDRPELLRTFLPDGAGTRALAVGYPGGLSLAFDAHACRLSYAWEGNFLDASPVWNNRGGAPAKLLGQKFLTPPPGQPWAVTSSRTPPDFGKRAAEFAFGAPVPDNQLFAGAMKVAFAGYTLDAAGVPAFHYRVTAEDGDAALGVTDVPTPVRAAVATGLKRTFTLDRPAAGTVWYNAGTAAKVPRVVGGAAVADGQEVPAAGAVMVLPQANDRAVVLALSAGPPGSAWRFVRSGNDWRAVLRLPEAAGSTNVVLTTWALPRDDDVLLGGLNR